MIKKRIATMILSGILCVGMTACGAATTTSSASATSVSPVSSDGSVSENEEITISLIMKIGSAEYFDLLAAGAEAYAAKHSEINLRVKGPTSYTAYDEQLNMIETELANDSVDAYIISPLQSDTAAHVLAGETRPVIAVDTDIDAPEVISFVGTGNEQAAAGGGEKAVEAAKNLGWDEVKVIALTGGQGDQTHEQRVKGYRQGVENTGGIFLEDETQYCDALAERATTAMEAIIQKYPEGIACILCTNDDMAMAAARVARNSGNANYENTVFCGFDGNYAACEAVRDGEITMTVAQDAYGMGYEAIEVAVRALNGEKLDAFVDSGSSVITQENVEERLAKLDSII